MNDNTTKWYLRPTKLIPVSIVLAAIIVLGIVLYPLPNFKIQLPNADIDVLQGGEALLLVQVVSEHGYNESIALDIVEQPTGFTIDFFPRRGKLHNIFVSRLRIKAGLDAPIGSFKWQIRVTGADGRAYEKQLTVKVHSSDSKTVQEIIKRNLNATDLSQHRELWQETVNVIPYDELRYAGLFGHLKDTVFYAYNAPWRIEGSKGSSEWEDAIRIHAERYGSGVKAKYLFFKKDGLDRAIKFWEDLQSRTKVDLTQSIEARICFNSGNQSIFFFWEEETSRCVLYPAPFLSDGTPQLVLEIVASERVFALLKYRFIESWNKAQPVALKF
ncbi:MAG: hypothetical protein JRL30_02050 [Deltaproteobacteria bacterium]|nr:hypothetical protein [Deltaproteobacteria bacterium]